MENSRKSIRVVAALIRRDGKVFATQRGYGNYKDWWEFPGGKIEAGETPEQALVREIREELAADITVGRYLTTVEYDYPEFHLSMACYWCSVREGHLTLLEHEAAAWLPLNDLRQVNWLPADVLVIEEIERQADVQTVKETKRQADVQTVKETERQADKEQLFDKAEELDELAMLYEVSVMPLFEKDYLKEFYDFYRIRNRKAKLIPSEEDLDGSLRDLSGEYRWKEIAEKTKSLFGLPERIMVFSIDDLEHLKDELGGRRGCSGFFFVFDVMFCEYDGYTLCFICGTNN